MSIIGKKAKVQVGGQAVMEGVMMRSPNSFAVAVRRPNNEIVIKEDVWRSLWDRLKRPRRWDSMAFRPWH